MTVHNHPSHPAVVVYVNDSANQSATGGAPRLDGVLSGRKSGVKPALDPAAAHREFPGLWQRYLHENFANPKAVCQAFPVDERTARKWWNGENGCVGGHLRIAFLRDPQGVTDMLLAAG